MRYLKNLVIYPFLYLILPLLFLSVLELFFRYGGWGNDLSPWIETPAPGCKFYTKNPVFYQQFFDAPIDFGETEPYITSVRLPKPPNTIRIFVFGESAALGWPDSRYSFGRFLEAMLNKMFPEKRWEVINICFAGVNSHVLRYVAEKSIFLQPDVVLLYMGNNEVHGPFGIYHLFRDSVPLPHWLVQFRIRLENLYVVQNLKELAFRVKTMIPRRFSMVRYDDSRVKIIEENYKENLYSMVGKFVEAGIPVFVGTVASNIRDWVPMESWFRRNMSESEIVEWRKNFEEGRNLLLSNNFLKAREKFELALQIDDSPAILHFLLGLCFAQHGNMGEARRHFIEAREKDGFGFVRAKIFINEAIKSTVWRFESTGKVFLVPVEEELSSVAFANSPGEEMFVDSCHFNFYGAYLTACVYLKYLVNRYVMSNNKNNGKEEVAIPTFDEVKKLLFLPWVEKGSGRDFSSGFREVSIVHYPEGSVSLDIGDEIESLKKKLFCSYYENLPLPESLDRFSYLESSFGYFDNLKNPRNDTVYRFVEILQEFGCFREALRIMLEKLDGNEPCDVNYLSTLIELYLQIDTPKHRMRAKILIDELRDKEAYKSVYLYYLLRYLIQTRDWIEARKVSSQLSHIYPLHPSKRTFSLCVNSLLDESESFERKVEKLGKILGDYSWSWDAFVFLNDWFSSDGERRAYKNLLLRLVDKKVNSPFPYIILASVFREEADYISAVDMLRKAIDVSPNMWITYYRLAKMLNTSARKDMLDGNTESAISKLEESIKIFPYYFDSWEELVTICGAVEGDEEYVWTKLKELEEIRNMSTASHLWEIIMD